MQHLLLVGVQFFVLRFEGEWVLFESLLNDEASEIFELGAVMTVTAVAVHAANESLSKALTI